MANQNLSNAKNAKNDEFYTQYADIQKEMNAYLDYNPDVFRGKTILLPCDDPEWSNFTKFFAQNFERFGLKKLISTSYAPDSKKYKYGYQPSLFETENPQFDIEKTQTHGKIFILERDKSGDGKIDVEDLEWEVKRHLNEYFYYGGLPEILSFKNKRAMLSSLYQKIYLGDICARNNIKNDRVLNILIKKMAESVKQPLSYNRLKNVIVATGAPISVPTTIDYADYASDSWLILPMENEVGKLTEKEMQKKYYFVDNGLLNLFLMNSETSLLENVVAVELCRRFGKKNVFFLNAEKEIDFIVPDEKLAIQVSYSIKDATTYNREVPPLVKYAKAHQDWKCLLITYDEEGTEEGIPVVSVWKWLMEV